MTLLLNPRVWLSLLLAAILAITHLSAYRAGRHAIQAKWDEATVTAERSAQEQASRMREMQRKAELRYVVTREGQDRFFVTTVREIRDASEPLAACPLPDAVRLRLNAAAACAKGDSPASCGPARRVPSP